MNNQKAVESSFGSEENNAFLYDVSGYSMWPFLKGREKLLVKKTPFENLKIGDLIVYRSDKQLICHRIIKKVKNCQDWVLYARGDNSASIPELVQSSMFQGKVVGILDRGRVIGLETAWIKAAGWMLIVFGPTIGRIARFIKKLFFLTR